MAALHDRNGNYRVIFRYGGKQLNYSIGRVSEDDALAAKARIEYLLRLVKQRVMAVPGGMSIVEFLKHDGKPPTDTESAKTSTLAEVRDAYLLAFGNGAVEASTLSTIRVHFKHLVKTYGNQFELSTLTLAEVQRHVNRRQKHVAGVTIKKEIDTLRGVWSWAASMGHISGPFPSGKLIFPKADEKLPFMTWAEITRRIEAGGDPETLWECLYLNPAETAELLKFIKTAKGPKWLFPMFFVGAYTGMRRSELIRAEVSDVDFAAGVITVREKKRSRGTRTTRRVPMTDALTKLLKKWIDGRPDARFLFGKGTRMICLQVTQELFRQAVVGSKWEVLSGFHTLRHAFVSACASKNVDQRLIQEWCGHMDERTSRRYRHLYPSTQRDAIKKVFG